jgi:hypothetical protein
MPALAICFMYACIVHKVRRKSWGKSGIAAIFSALELPGFRQTVAIYAPQLAKLLHVGVLRQMPSNYATREVSGNSSQVLPSRIRPVRFLLNPPHCLKKNGTLADLH